jgi:hypothetical protein
MLATLNPRKPPRLRNRYLRPPGEILTPTDSSRPPGLDRDRARAIAIEQPMEADHGAGAHLPARGCSSMLTRWDGSLDGRRRRGKIKFRDTRLVGLSRGESAQMRLMPMPSVLLLGII